MSITKAHKGKTISNDMDLRNNLIIEYLPFVKKIVYRLTNHLPSHVETDDLLHAGIIGLIQAVDRFDPNRG